MPNLHLIFGVNVGPIIAKVKISNIHDKSKYLDIDLLVDTGSTYTWINGEKLKNLEIKPIDERKFRTIENKIVNRQIGEAVFECMEKKATSIVVFAQKTDNEVLGLHALEGLGLEVDPITKKLKEVEAILALNCPKLKINHALDPDAAVYAYLAGCSE